MDAAPLCEPWPVSGCADLSSIAVPVSGVGMQAASEALWAASGRRFGSCAVTFRPCARRCLDQPYGGWWWDPGGFVAGWPYGPTHGGWIQAVCGSCPGSCACTSAAELRLPAPAQAVSQVSVDGVALTSPANYVLYDGNVLVRTDGADWPFCQDWATTSGVGTFEVTAIFGAPVPALGAMAMGEIVPEVLKACVSDSGCKLPSGVVQSVSRQGVNKVFVDVAALREAGRAGISIFPLTGMFLDAFNPSGLQIGAKIWDPDEMLDRRAGGAW